MFFMYKELITGMLLQERHDLRQMADLRFPSIPHENARKKRASLSLSLSLSLCLSLSLSVMFNQKCLKSIAEKSPTFSLWVSVFSDPASASNSCSSRGFP